MEPSSSANEPDEQTDNFTSHFNEADDAMV